MHLVTFVFVSIELVILFYLGIHTLARPDDDIVKLNIILIALLLIYNITGGLLPDPKLPGSFFVQEAIAYATGFITPCYFPYYVYRAFGLKQLKFHAYKGVFLFLVLPYFIFIVVFAITDNLKNTEKLLVLPVLYAIWVISSLINAIRVKYQKGQSSKESRAEITVLLLSIVPWIGLPVVTYFDMGQTIEALITNLGFLLLFGFQVKHNIKLERTEHKKLLESERKLQSWNTDLREQVKLRTTQLERLNEQRMNNFINLVHEIKTPLTLVKNYVEEYIENHPKSKELEIIKGSVDKLVADVINLFDVDRFTKGIGVYNHNQITDLSGILRKEVNFFETYCEKRRIICEKDIEKDIFIKADPNAVNRIIDNIIENAIKYSSEGDKVKITLKGTENEVFFIVEDTGVGIDPEKMKRIFEPYFQISHKTTALQGMGLGLPIVKKILATLNGNISIESNSAIARGTKVIIRFHRHIFQESEIPFKESVRFNSTMYDFFDYDLIKRPYENHKKAILLIEDSRAMLHFLSTKLSDKYNVFFAFNGTEALRMLNGLPALPDLILSDVMMDKMDGVDFARIISEHTQYNHIPIIFLTAKSDPTDKLKGLNAGAIDYILKPFSFSLLGLKIENILSNIDKQHRAIINSTILNFGYNKNEKGISTHVDMENFNQICKLHKLTNRETEIAKLLREGKSYKSIARVLFISDRTVTKHIQNIFEKAGVSNKIELINKLS